MSAFMYVLVWKQPFLPSIATADVSKCFATDLNLLQWASHLCWPHNKHSWLQETFEPQLFWNLIPRACLSFNIWVFNPGVGNLRHACHTLYAKQLPMAHGSSKFTY